MRMLKWALIGLVALAFLGTFFGGSRHSGATAGTDWKLVGTAGGKGAPFGRYGYFRFVLVNPHHSRDRQMYDDAIEEVCHSDEYCTVIFWSQKHFIPATMPMSEAQADHEVASYWNNPSSGASEFLWKCAKGDDPNACFP